MDTDAALGYRHGISNIEHNRSAGGLASARSAWASAWRLLPVLGRLQVLRLSGLVKMEGGQKCHSALSADTELPMPAQTQTLQITWATEGPDAAQYYRKSCRATHDSWRWAALAVVDHGVHATARCQRERSAAGAMSTRDTQHASEAALASPRRAGPGLVPDPGDRVPEWAWGGACGGWRRACGMVQ